MPMLQRGHNTFFHDGADSRPAHVSHRWADQQLALALAYRKWSRLMTLYLRWNWRLDLLKVRANQRELLWF